MDPGRGKEHCPVVTMCPLCERSTEPGWLCAEHPGLPWEHDGCGAEGVRCVCNPTGAVLWREIYAEVPPEEPPALN
jgi:hypothetical protein